MSRVLIIDDESGIRLALQRWFTRQGWSVLEAADGADALATMRESVDDAESRIDLVICDLHLPLVSGEMLFSALSHERPALVSRMIFSTGDAVETAPPDSVLARHPHVLQKPFELSTLRSLVDAIMQTA